MKPPLSSLLRPALAGATLLFAAFVSFPALLRAAEKQLYTCGMHPQIIRDAPGNCPICGMKLQPVRANTAAPGAAASSGERQVKYYKSTMIPGQVSDQPGKDTMGMDLVPVYEGGDSSAFLRGLRLQHLARLDLNALKGVAALFGGKKVARATQTITALIREENEEYRDL